MATMEDLIATISGSMHVGQDGYDLKQLQAHLSQTLYQPHQISATGYSAIPPSRSTSSTRQCRNNAEPAAPPSSYTSSFTPSSFPSTSSFAFPSPMIQTDSAMLTPKGRPAMYARKASYGFPTSTTSLPASPNALPHHHAVLPSPGGCDDGAFVDDAFAPLWQAETKSSWGAFQAPQAAATQDPWCAFRQCSETTSSLSASSSAVNVRDDLRDQDDMEMDAGDDMDDEDEDCVEQAMGGWRENQHFDPREMQQHQHRVGWDQRGRQN